MKNIPFLLLLFSFTFAVGYSKAEQQIANLKNVFCSDTLPT